MRQNIGLPASKSGVNFISSFGARLTSLLLIDRLSLFSVVMGSLEVMRITEKDFAGYTELSTEAYEVLSQDVKLMSLLDKTKEVFEERYQTLVQLRKTN